MALNSALVRVAGIGEISLAEAGTPEPSDATTPPPAAWTGLSLSTSDGVTVRRSADKQGTEHWQRLTPARYINQGQELTVASTFQESTDSHQLRPVAGDTAEAEAVKVVSRAHKTLIWERTRHTQRLRPALRGYFPAALEAFTDLDAGDTLELLGRDRIRTARRGCRSTRSVPR